MLDEEQGVEGNALHQSVRRHALGWLVVANTVGLWLAALLLWPDLNDLTAPFTYGRWMPLHLDWQLYGWCALPLVGALFRFYFDDSPAAVRAGRVGLWTWTLALAYAGATWLAGGASGKLFIDFAGSARVAWSLALLVLWALLAWFGVGRDRAECDSLGGWDRGSVRGPSGDGPSRREPFLGNVLLLLLLSVPFLLYWASDPAVYPAVNPSSGGPTGTSLLGSTLVVVALFGILPHLLRLKRTGSDRYFWPALVLSAAVYAGMRHTNVSHHEFGQIAGMGLLLAWIPAMVVYGRTHRWSGRSRRWLAAAFAWWLGLVSTGFLFFLPGWSERLKFTNALVAHTHLAMAGLVTSLHVAILLNLPGRWAPRAWSFWLWQTGCALHIVALFWLGWHEGAEPTLLYVRGGLADWCYGFRFAAGAAMWVASIHWLWVAWKPEQ
jgi:cytochrome c oxidase cbb3-type subunit 1